MYHVEVANHDENAIVHTFPIRINEADSISLSLKNIAFYEGFTMGVELKYNYQVAKIRKVKLMDRINRSKGMVQVLKAQYFRLMDFKEFNVKPSITISRQNKIRITIPPHSCLASSSRSLLVSLGFPEDAISSYEIEDHDYHVISNLFSGMEHIFEAQLPVNVKEKGSTWKAIYFGFQMEETDVVKKTGGFWFRGEMTPEFINVPLNQAIQETNLRSDFITVGKSQDLSLDFEDELMPEGIKAELKLTGSGLKLFQHDGAALGHEFTLAFGGGKLNIYKLAAADVQKMNQIAHGMGVLSNPEDLFHVHCANMPLVQRSPDGVIAYVDRKLRVFPMNKIYMDNGEFSLKFEFIRTNGSYLWIKNETIIVLQFLAEYINFQ